MVPEFTPTPEQQAVVEATARADANLMVSAFAGCSKTTTLVLAARQVRVPGLALAFNKRIAQEMVKKLPANFASKTMNGLGHGAWARALPSGTSLKIEDKKLGKLVSQVAKDQRVELGSDQWDDCRRLATKAMSQGLVLRGEPFEGLLPDDDATWRDLCDGLWIVEDQQGLMIDLARQILERDVALARQGVISFDDQIYCSAMLGGRFPQYPVTFVDEAQDLSPLNHRMVALATRADGRLLAVGDPHQAIYAFRGADGASMGKIRALRHEASWKDLPLATTFRCPKVIVERQQGHVPGFRAWHTNPEGHFEALQGDGFEGHATAAGEEFAWSWEDIQRRLPNPGASLAVLCRNNAPLMSMAFRLLRRGVGVFMLGTDIGKGLISLSRKLAPEDATPVDALRASLDEWESSESSKAIANGKEERVAGIADRAECLRATLEGAACRDAGELRLMLGKLFAREAGQVTLASIHRAKGLEWDMVVHLDPWRIPSRQAKQALRAGDPIPMEQELNLRYVAETRAKWGLINVNLEEFR